MAALAVLAMLVATSAFAESKKKKLKIFVLAGQSNMQSWVGKGSLANGLKDSPETKYLYDKLFDEKGVMRTTEGIYRPQLKDVEYWLPKEQQTEEVKKGISRAGGKLMGGPKAGGRFGPNLSFAVTMGEVVDQPILIITTAFGGKSL